MFPSGISTLASNLWQLCLWVGVFDDHCCCIGCGSCACGWVCLMIIAAALGVAVVLVSGCV